MKRSRFFCENCHHEVKPTAKVCPHCGRFFEAVRCPVCSYVGESRDFVHGCPNCGYAGGDAGAEHGFEQVDYEPERGERGSGGRSRGSGTPDWVWPLAIGILLVVFVGLVVVYLKL
ncbi:MAG: double zinc ribbon domain-containing protein [Spirochaetota bacterium]